MLYIPKIIHQIWYNEDGEPVPEAVFKPHWRVSWKKHHQEWHYILWEKERIEKFVQETFPDLWATWDGYDVTIKKSDALKYLILYELGGVYIDLDFECLKPIDDVMQNAKCILTVEPKEHEFFLAQSMFAATPKHNFMKHCIDNLVKYRYEYVYWATGPGLLSYLYRHYKNKRGMKVIRDPEVFPWHSKHVKKKILSTKTLGIHYSTCHYDQL
jgi:mannosyltransferase OCH1-like enzyme